MDFKIDDKKDLKGKGLLFNKGMIDLCIYLIVMCLFWYDKIIM